MTSNYPPGVTGAQHQTGAARFECPAHGTNWGYSWTELGGFFVENPLPHGVDEFANDNSQACPDECDYMDRARWETEVEAARCNTIVYQARNRHDNVIEHTIACGAWTTNVVDWAYIEYGEMTGKRISWDCPHGHEFETEEV
ncbi:MAG: hypothetical protein GY906_10325 [bacterium]|nr:hypothetical protein [bacterium]